MSRLRWQLRTYIVGVIAAGAAGLMLAAFGPRPGATEDLLVVAILLGLAGGYFLDRALGTSPWLFFLGFLVGFAAGVANLYRAATAASDSNRSPKP